MRRLCILVLIAACTPVFAIDHIDLTEGTLSISGSFTLNYDLTGFLKPEHKLALITNVGGGYFVMDRLEVGLGLPGEWIIAPSSTGAIGLQLFSTYFFEVHQGFFPYAGAHITPGYSLNAREFELKAGAAGGVLFSLSDSVALDVGIRPEIFFKVYDSKKWKFSLPAGFIGIKAVF